MQARTIAKLAVAKLAALGVGYAIYKYVRARRRAAPVDSIATQLESLDGSDAELDDDDDDAWRRGLSELGDPVELASDAQMFAGLDEAGGFHIEHGDRRAALADPRLDTAFDAAHELDSRARRDSGDLYGVVTQAAVDTDLTAGEAEDGFAHSEDGETWLEALSASATEYGALPERTLDVTDDRDAE